MDPRQVALILIAIGAVIAVAGLAIGLHGVATGRLAVVSLAGFAAVFVAILTGAGMRRDVRYLPRERHAPAPSRGGPESAP